jgi:hypothetical protein
MKLLDDNLLVEIADDPEASERFGEDDMELLNSLEKMVKEVEDEPGSID